MTTYEVYITPEIDLSLVPPGTNIEISSFIQNQNEVEVTVSHKDELTVKRLVFQVWGLTKDENCFEVGLV